MCGLGLGVRLALRESSAADSSGISPRIAINGVSASLTASIPVCCASGTAFRRPSGNTRRSDSLVSSSSRRWFLDDYRTGEDCLTWQRPRASALNLLGSAPADLRQSWSALVANCTRVSKSQIAGNLLPTTLRDRRSTEPQGPEHWCSRRQAWQLPLSGPMEDDEIQVNCGRCGRSFVIRLEDIGGKRTLECAGCSSVTPTSPHPLGPCPSGARPSAGANELNFLTQPSRRRAVWIWDQCSR